MRDPNVGDRIDQYQVTEILARGGMASIFRAVDTESGASVVLKVPHLQYESDIVFHDRFRREEEIGLRLDHPGVVRILKPREKSRLYLVMEHIDGRLLSSVLRSRGRLPADEALGIARQVCDALVHMHDRGVVHRDIKPENILLTADGRVKVIDFGIALLKSARRLTWHGFSTPVGTPDYMAPEQAKGHRGDARSDVYAVGTLLYELLTGHLPLAGEEPVAVLRAKANGEPRLPSYHVPGFDPALEAIIMKAIARLPRDRYATVSELLGDLRDPSAAAPGVRQEGTHRREDATATGRRRLLMSFVLVAVLAALASLIWLSHARRARPDSLPGAESGRTTRILPAPAGARASAHVSPASPSCEATVSVCSSYEKRSPKRDQLTNVSNTVS